MYQVSKQHILSCGGTGDVMFYTYHNSSAFWVNSQELSRDNAPAAALPKCFLVNLFKHVFGWVVFQDDNATTVTS